MISWTMVSPTFDQMAGITQKDIVCFYEKKGNKKYAIVCLRKEVSIPEDCHSARNTILGCSGIAMIFPASTSTKEVTETLDEFIHEKKHYPYFTFDPDELSRLFRKSIEKSIERVEK